MTIRQDALDSLRAQLAGRHGATVVEAAMALYRKIAARQTSASAWIDGRDDPRAILRDLRTPDDAAEAKAILAAAE